MKISSEEMRSILWGDSEDGEIISDKITGNSRWSIFHDIVFSYKGKTYQTEYSVGATESQDESPFEYDKMVDCEEVRLVRMVREVWTTDFSQPLIDYDLLKIAARDFIDKVETGRARSVSSYNKFRAALGEAVSHG
jgi:hypothetical protein